MSMRSDWVAAKTEAKKLNNKKEVKFAKNLNLGGALDTFVAAEKAYDKKVGDMGPEWAKLADTWVASAKKVAVIAETYRRQLSGMPINHVAKLELDTHLVMKVMNKANLVMKEGTRLEPLLKKHRKK